MTDLSKWAPFVERGECEGNQAKCNAVGCRLFGKLPRKPSKDGKRRVRGCGDPVARGKRAKQAGARGQRDVAKQLGINVHGLHGGHEENYGGLVRVEVKQGGQVAAAWRAFLKHANRERPTLIAGFWLSDGVELLVASSEWFRAGGFPPSLVERPGPLDTQWRKTRAQSEQARPVGDVRPFVTGLVPKGTKVRLLICERDRLGDVQTAMKG